ncbi:glycosyltransferase family 2 protein [Brevibacillus laterosporus]|uniref:glycosyltransferase family 2 protein n=1 Tax=Brevibacillus laterosporus TaxID=1465 RepID=UPI00131592A8|nr:glycosyltransferase [Brevibacillus laterosporus]
MGNHLNISIVIPNRSDLRIKNLLESIDYYNDNNKTIEIIIVLNKPTEELKKLTYNLKEKMKEKFVFKIVNIEFSNFGLAYNTGIQNATYDNILFLDSDLICGKGSIKLMVEDLIEQDVSIVKSKLIYERKDSFWDNLVYKSRLVTTTNAEPPYIPVILIKKQIFRELNDGYMFPVDTVWCADADFAYRVLDKKIKIFYNDAKFYHASISIKKDLYDAILYGFGKGIRTKRTKEKWNPIKEAIFITRLGVDEKLSFMELIYLFVWGSLMQIACLVQLLLPNGFFLKESLSFEKSANID